jgi:hypothetical protein
VAVALKNSGFEEALPSKGDASSGTMVRGAVETKPLLVPEGWGTIYSNAFQCAEFVLDGKIRHSGKTSLRTAPAKDPKTGIEYAFIVKSANFQTNAATDVVYTVWLRAASDNTPVDIALLESEYKGQGTYVKRVMVGKEWKQYELKCRLHNWVNQA